MSRTSYLRRPLATLLMAAALAASVVMALVVLASPAWAATYTVINTNDSGARLPATSDNRRQHQYRRGGHDQLRSDEPRACLQS